MARSRQADLLQASVQGEMFETPAEPAYRPNVDKVRARLEKLLAEARAAQVIPGEPSQLPPLPAYLPADDAVAR